MNNQTYLWLIVGMLVATYLPRVIPFYLIDQKKMPSWLYRILSYIPYAMLGALILPGVLDGVEGMPIVSLLSFLGGVLICFKWGGTMVPILVAIALATGLQMLL